MAKKLTEKQRRFVEEYLVDLNATQATIRAGYSVEEIVKQLGMRPEEVFRLSDFSKEDFLQMMIKPNMGYSKAEFIAKI